MRLTFKPNLMALQCHLILPPFAFERGRPKRYNSVAQS